MHWKFWTQFATPYKSKMTETENLGSAVEIMENFRKGRFLNSRTFRRRNKMRRSAFLKSKRQPNLRMRIESRSRLGVHMGKLILAGATIPLVSMRDPSKRPIVSTISLLICRVFHPSARNQVLILHSLLTVIKLARRH